MRIHNTLTRSIEEFTPQDEKVTFYSCGPTVYDTQTIGNYTSYIRWDLLYRTLKTLGQVDWYMNITDVGHLVSDADDGEDKLEKGAKREGKTAWQVAEYYTEDFLKGLDDLNISIPRQNLVKATDNIDEQIDLIKKLEEKGFTYQIRDGVYFDSTKFPDYGKMAKLDIEGLQAGARVDIGDKKHPTDFALWKFTPEGQDRDMEWESPWGKGFPGWHIECSAMSMKYLGETIDIHTGGIDHIPIHHTNEIAQSEAATGQQFVKYWLHSNFLKVDNTKIAKSLGNGYSLKDLESKDFSPMDFRLFVLQSHYQTEANFSWANLKAAQVRLKNLQAMADLRFQPNDSSAEQIASLTNESEAKILQALQDNLNSPVALAELSRLADKLSNRSLFKDGVEDFTEFIKRIDSLLGFKLAESKDINAEQKQLIASRLEARSKKDWQTSDQIRDQLSEAGIGLSDLAADTIWYRL